MDLPRIRDNDWTVGVLIAHGEAPYQFEEGNSLSYYAKLRTLDEDGEKTLWGADLKRAIKDSKSKIKLGQRVAARLVGREPLQGRPSSGNPGIPRYRNIWEVETPAFIAQRQATARQIIEDPVGQRRVGAQHPEMTGLYLVLRGAELIAKHRYSNAQDRKIFVDRVRHLLSLTPHQDAVKAMSKKSVATPAAREV